MKECQLCSLCLDDDQRVCSSDGAPLAAGFPGDRILDGKYRVDRRLGEGGMGLIYRARHLALQRNFAVKVIQPRGGDDPMFLSRFRLEAEALGRLKHPNIVDVTDFGVDPRQGGLPYLVMEYLEGTSLGERIRLEGPLEPEAAIPILEAIASAVDFAHGRGVLHRDLKPANVFLCKGWPPGEAVKVLDFGLARLTDASLSADASVQATLSQSLTGQDQPATPAKALTEAGVMLGTILYIPPEVVCSEPATAASDIYSLGILAYETFVGRPPFIGGAREVLVSHVRDEPPAPSSLSGSLRSEFDEALVAPLAKLPQKRPRKASDLVTTIRAASARARVSRWRRTELPRRIGFSVAAGLVVTAASAFLWKSSMLAPLERRTVDLRFLSLPAKAPDPRIFLVSIDDATLEADNTPLSQKADEFGRELDRAFSMGAKAAAVDLLLPEAWSRSEPFSQLVLRHAPMLTLAALSSPSGAVVGPECVGGVTAAALGPGQASELFGAVNLMEDTDGVVRRARIFYRDGNGGERNTLAARAAGTLAFDEMKRLRQNVGDSPLWIDYSAARDQLKRISWKDLVVEDGPGSASSRGAARARGRRFRRWGRRCASGAASTGCAPGDLGTRPPGADSQYASRGGAIPRSLHAPLLLVAGFACGVHYFSDPHARESPRRPHHRRRACSSSTLWRQFCCFDNRT